MKAGLLISIFIVFGGILRAQEIGLAQIPPDNLIKGYLFESEAYASLYNGKIETPYERRYVNHPYFESGNYLLGTLCYNQVVYKDVLMRFDLNRNALTVRHPDQPHRIVLNNEKFGYAILNGSTIVLSVSEHDSKDKFLVLLHTGIFPVVKKFKVGVSTESSTGDLYIRRYFRIQEQYEVYINGIPRPVRSKNSILKLFPDRKKELNMYAKQHRLDFRRQTEQSIIALVAYYESLTNGTQMTQMSHISAKNN